MDNINLKDSIASMQRNIKRYVDTELEKHKVKEAAKQGTIRGERLVYGNKSYSYMPVVDEYFDDGDEVWFLLNAEETLAIIIGV